ncbi:valine--pyruvate transaminase [Verrucomicrobiaceae bacterium R5-34]|uniref:Valine--pyruvate transaminase n=1 Tax=Oceaniferula flava TaxID=2800421 RepID=A0AAE2SEC8_9BACT|nr:valine--pyruvate transaminase [Oceaniferula flavus]MBK1831268.1 valine--pyruvate transaminase [Verrucomicrobiaceae bacterium R5-34]MBK1855437.1 valine--pyruvate transaminase [Oceaniferula flavus]MBM1136743.1 valine--pyruvate transaminase [Oceaniferula flavus]
MSENFSNFGQRLCMGSGIEELMDDLGNALVNGGPDTKMLGGGQPAHIPEVNALWRRRMEEILSSPGGMEKMLANYDPPRGNPIFLESIAQLFRENFGWDISAKNIAITAGGQTAFFFLFNALAGEFKDGSKKKILLPLVPEYIGYSNQSVGSDIFRAVKPMIEKIGEHDFKYRVDFDNLNVDDDIAAICVSRPTNPTGNVLTDNEIAKLRALADEKGIPLIIDNAYGAPFPNIIFTEATPVWNDNIVLTLSLSKIGLPGTRTGIVIAREEIAAAVSSMSAIVGLANGNVGQQIMQPLVESGEILKLSNEVVKPFYVEKSRQARAWVEEAFDPELPYRVHLSEGALFLWLWFEDLPITTAELYERLKKRGVLVVSGHYFFFGLEDESWQHRHECIRMTYTMDERTVQGGIQIIAEEVAAAYAGKTVEV